MNFKGFVPVASDLELAGLEWQPEIGDEIVCREDPARVSILVDPAGLTPGDLRSIYIWLPSVEQLVLQFEVRQAFLEHAGFELSERSMGYKAVVQAPDPVGVIEKKGTTLRTCLGLSLLDLLLSENDLIQ